MTKPSPRVAWPNAIYWKGSRTARNWNRFARSTVADFLAAWAKHAGSKPDEAPLLALPELGLLADDRLFDSGMAVERRLARNLEITQQLLHAQRNQLTNI